MKGSRQLLCTILDRSKVAAGILGIRSRLGSPWLTVLTYHRVFDPPKDYALDSGVIDAHRETFDAQLAALKRHFNVVTTKEVIDHFDGETPLPPNPAMVTFDDGYRDNLQVAAPILQRHGLPGVFFIATSFVEERRIYWWDRIAYLLNTANADNPVIELEYPTHLVLDLRQCRRAALGTLLHLIKEQFALDIERLLEELAAKLNVPWDRKLEARLAEKTIMTWDEVRKLHAMGMDVQSHTRTHRALHTLSHQDLVEELAGSKSDLESAIGAPVEAISYPIGRPNVSMASVQSAIEAAGYRVGFTNGTGPHLLWGPARRFDVGRIAMEEAYTGAFFRGMLAIPQLG